MVAYRMETLASHTDKKKISQKSQLIPKDSSSKIQNIQWTFTQRDMLPLNYDEIIVYSGFLSHKL